MLDIRTRDKQRIGKGKVGLLIKHHDIKTYGGVEIQLHTFLTSALD
jgi:hypothetical protein